MRYQRTVGSLTLGLLLVCLIPSRAGLGAPFVRADCNGDGSVDLRDPLRTLRYLLVGGPAPGCLDAVDANDDGVLDLSDAFRSLAFLFHGAPAPDAPFPYCGDDPTADTLECGASAFCEVQAPNIRIALRDCTAIPPSEYPNSLRPGSDLHKVTLAAPRATCNDGTPAVFYVRAAAPESPDRGRWVIYLQGGGGCADFVECSKRWCGAESYDASKMSSAFTPETIGATGVFLREPENHFGNANQVFVYYCSSDSWSGQNDDAVLTDPGNPERRLSLHFRGHTILEAVLDELLPGGLTSDDGAVTMPALADARAVLLAGFSAGSGGVQRNGDWFASRFDPERTDVGLVFDAAFGLRPDLHPVPARASELAAASDQRSMEGWDIRFAPTVWNGFVDESCRAYYLGTDQEWRCADNSEVAHNFITTPYFVRFDIFDSSARKNYGASIGATDDDVLHIARATLLALPDMREDAVEGPAMARAPGAMGPLCGDHTSLTKSGTFFSVTVEDENGTPRNYHDALVAWVGGEDVLVVDDPDARTSVCGPPPPTE